MMFMIYTMEKVLEGQQIHGIRSKMEVISSIVSICNNPLIVDKEADIVDLDETKLKRCVLNITYSSSLCVYICLHTHV